MCQCTIVFITHFGSITDMLGIVRRHPFYYVNPMTVSNWVVKQFPLWTSIRCGSSTQYMSTTLPLLLDRCVSVYVVVCAFRLLGPGPSVCVCMRA